MTVSYQDRLDKSLRVRASQSLMTEPIAIDVGLTRPLWSDRPNVKERQQCRPDGVNKAQFQGQSGGHGSRYLKPSPHGPSHPKPSLPMGLIVIMGQAIRVL